MATDEWFRRKSWTATDREDFYLRLRRSRGGFHKAQYSRIQAYELQAVGTAETLSGAVELLEKILAEWPADAQLAAVHQQYAQCLLRLGQQEKAIESFRNSFRAQRQNPGHLTEAHLDFGWLCISVPLPDFYDEALLALDEFQYRSGFPVQIYRDAAIRAIIHHARNSTQTARDYAKQAVAAAALERSPYRYHQTLGLVTLTEPTIHARLQAIVG